MTEIQEIMNNQAKSVEFCLYYEFKAPLKFSWLKNHKIGLMNKWLECLSSCVFCSQI